MKRVFVTGADGLLGNNLVRLLLKEKYTVKVFLQSGKPMGYLADLPVEVSHGDILNYNEVASAMKGSQVVIHAAALTNTWPTRGPIYYKVNVEGTRNVIEAAKSNHIERFIHIGTSNSFGAGTEDALGHESNAFVADKYKLDYITSKYRAQELVLQEVKENNFPALICNPTFMIGPYDVKPSSGKMIVSVARGEVPGYSKGGRNFVYVGDVAQAVVNAIEKGTIGEGYILGNVNLSYRDMFAKIAGIVGETAPKIPMPPVLVEAYGMVSGWIGTIRKKEPVINYPLAVISNEQHYYDCGKAVRELDMPQTPIEDAIREAVAWFNKEGYLP
ncbi:MAG: NAD-dependent epimerase/dehydratase family protein [Flavobacteriales bacterium]|nr:NAD-dependent epimerase/dehydratase family protein [Bacteroidota bacterium]MCB9241967.1 NAD-dependent epimerase/dehydratase family protein [Flavobacteriales bacterium]